MTSIELTPAIPLETSTRSPSEAAVQTTGEEIANAVTHGLGALLSVAALTLLVSKAVAGTSAIDIVSSSIFGAALTVLYLTSTLYHAIPNGRIKHLFRNGDHMAIYVLIAGSYTMVSLTALEGTVGWGLFAAQWIFALAGVVFKAIVGFRFHLISTLGYVVMGWMAAPFVFDMWEVMPNGGFAWLVAGGLFYTLGVPFFLLDQRIRYFHSIWHGFVMAGSICHFVMAYFYLI
jgi:hemolysin III